MILKTSISKVGNFVKKMTSYGCFFLIVFAKPPSTGRWLHRTLTVPHGRIGLKTQEGGGVMLSLLTNVFDVPKLIIG